MRLPSTLHHSKHSIINELCRDSFSLGSIVQKGKFSAEAALLVSTLKKVDFLQKRTAGRGRRTRSASAAIVI